MVPAVCIEGVSKRFGAFTALDGVNLDIRKGELICFLGPSGCGKTTLLRIIAGLEQQSAGRIIQDGRDVSRLPTSARDFGIVFQSYALFPNLTVADNIGYGLVNLKIPKAARDARVEELLGLIGLPESRAKFPAQLSGGQQQRVALARALATSPSLLLLDEPLSALDARVRLHLRSEIKSLQQRLGITTILVTHDQEEALTMADRIVVMNHGVIEQVGSPEEVYAAPRSRFAAEFVGAMNFVTAQIVGDGLADCAGQRILCDTRGLPAGAIIDLAVRPEDVHLFPDAPGAEGLAGSIDALEFQGASLRASVRLAGSGVMTPILCALSRRQVAEHGFISGTRCRAQIAPRAAVAFPCQ
ncbi:MAG: putative 2-aminoethylphosphonate ABC transporter ATP-binding protein [Novosphingobium sp.]|uniref:putative 2-aminoethylphosphonate ABC transporter ATP-binding protein n=1 Tax=Novosphingobium sp. TaxID=1874826 RepID=UPI0022CBC0BF|nr:putative 2-aminoethylphosphonate ABC transporter ATP-binding protein [Novosphingobium sp.]MCZ8036360.1 putative 2-aminoethylphosphonate ABC transporter ATP-binding protein [Novosphingobium sp.]